MEIQRQSATMQKVFLRAGENVRNGNRQGILAEKTSLQQTSCKVTISKEGMQHYRDSLEKMEGSHTINIDELQKYKEKLSKSVPDIMGQMQADFHKRFVGLNSESGEKDCTATDFSRNCLTVYAQMYDEIKRGYADGTREIYIADMESDTGFRRVTEEEELAALDEAMEFHGMVIDGYENYGRKAGIDAREAVERSQAELNNRCYQSQTEKNDGQELKNLQKRLMDSAGAIKNQYTAYAENLNLLVNKVLKENISVMF